MSSDTEEEERDDAMFEATLKKNAAKKFTYGKLIEGFRNNQFKKVVVCTGAGISVSAGIPDFRSPKTGLYANLQKYELPRPESIFELEYFRQKPEAFYHLAKEFLDLEKFDPTPTHFFIRLLQEKQILQVNMTQNIDNLEEKAGLDMDRRVVQAHGANRGAICATCGRLQDSKKLQKAINEGKILKCELTALVSTGEEDPETGKDIMKEGEGPCGGFVKP